ncbi:MAG TPA: response regulator [bacterium]|nr:response regulator [bacterium]
MKLMIIDDEPDVAHLAARRIRSWGHDVVCLYEGEGAVEAVRRERPALILLDIRLSGLSGIDVYRGIREEESLKSTPIVFFSAHGSQEEYCLNQLGAQGFIRKPYDPEEFRETITNLLGKGG